MSEPHSTLEEAMATISDPLDAMVEVGDGVVASAVPMADSRAMADIADAQARFQTATLTTPIENALTYASMSCRAAMDAAKALAHLLRHPDLFVWAPMITARAGLDAAGRAYWLLEPGVGAERRVQRCLTLRLHSGREMKRAPREFVEARQNGDAIVADVKAQASALGWTWSGRDKAARVGSEELPTSAKSIAAVPCGPQRARWAVLVAVQRPHARRPVGAHRVRRDLHDARHPDARHG